MFYDLHNQATFSMNMTVSSSTHGVEICDLKMSTKYKFYIKRVLRTDVGNGSDVQHFTTQEGRKYCLLILELIIWVTR